MRSLKYIILKQKVARIKRIYPSIVGYLKAKERLQFVKKIIRIILVTTKAIKEIIINLYFNFKIKTKFRLNVIRFVQFYNDTKNVV